MADLYGMLGLMPGQFSFGPQFPPMATGLVPYNAQSLAAALQRAPAVPFEDRRYMTSPINPFMHAATGFEPGRGYFTDPLGRSIEQIMMQQQASAR